MRQKTFLIILLQTFMFSSPMFAWQPQQFGDKKELSLVIVDTQSKQRATVKDSAGNFYYLSTSSEPLYDGKILKGIFVCSDTSDGLMGTLPVLVRESEYEKLSSPSNGETPIDKDAQFPGMAKKDTNVTAPHSAENSSNQFTAGQSDVNAKKNVTEGRPNAHLEVRPTFNGGDANEFVKWVMQHLRYPKSAREKGIQGCVMLSFKINEDGSVSDVKVLRGIEESLDKEAVRVVSSSPKWEPGMSQGRPVPVTYTFPVIFQFR